MIYTISNLLRNCVILLEMIFLVSLWIFFKYDMLPPKVNMTWVNLIPKFDDVVELKDYRPYKLIYKVIAKLLCKRISLVMPCLIGETQSAFVKGRQILDRALIANEVVH